MGHGTPSLARDGRSRFKVTQTHPPKYLLCDTARHLLWHGRFYLGQPDLAAIAVEGHSLDLTVKARACAGAVHQQDHCAGSWRVLCCQVNERVLRSLDATADAVRTVRTMWMVDGYQGWAACARAAHRSRAAYVSCASAPISCKCCDSHVMAVPAAGTATHCRVRPRNYCAWTAPIHTMDVFKRGNTRFIQSRLYAMQDTPTAGSSCPEVRMHPPIHAHTHACR